MTKLQLIPEKEWTDKDKEFMKISTEPKMLELIKLHT
jgi:hypothetical protein